MKTTQLISGSVISIILIVSILAGCAAKKNIWGDPETGLNLEYRMPEKGMLQYDLNSEYVQAMEVMGQKVDVASNSRNLFSMENSGIEDGSYKLNVTIDTAFIHFETTRGKLDPSMDGVIGKQFTYKVTPSGREVDYSEAEDLKYILGESEELSIASDFMTLFPDLPEGLVKVGDTWTSVDTANEKSNSGYLEIITKNNNMIQGIEAYNGYECLKIHTTFSGVLSGSGKMQGINTSTSGSIEGEGDWYFAYKEGIFIKISTTGQAKSTTEAKGEGREISIPGTRDFQVIAELVRQPINQ